MSKSKVTVEERIEAAKSCAEGRMSIAEVARRLGVGSSRVSEWVSQYKVRGDAFFAKQKHNNVYSAETKRKAVEEYLKGAGSLDEISAKFGLRSHSQLKSWIKVYNGGGDFDHKMSGGSRMKQGRETTQEERAVIAKDCLENGSNYGATAKKYNVSYQQVYTWVKNTRNSVRTVWRIGEANGL